MKRAERSAVFGSSIDKVWKLTTDQQNYFWRSDLAECSLGKGSFTEYAKNGISTEYTVVLCIPHERYELKLKNRIMTGRLTVVLQRENARTRCTVSTEVKLCTNNPFSHIFAGHRLKKQQKLYFRDLKKALGEVSP